jgi:hypothetical protein
MMLRRNTSKDCTMNTMEMLTSQTYFASVEEKYIPDCVSEDLPVETGEFLHYCPIEKVLFRCGPGTTFCERCGYRIGSVH